MDEKDEEQVKLRQELINIRCDLTSGASDIGDWKINKIYEARLQGNPDPYNADELIEAREAKRTRANEIRKQLGETVESVDSSVELDTGYQRTKEMIIRQFVAALMSEDADLQTELKAELKELDASYDEQKKG